MSYEVKKVASGLQMWDLLVNGVQVERFDTKWEAEAAAVIYQRIGENV